MIMRIFEFTNEPIYEGPEDPHIFKAVFMAGAPGSGKSTVANALFTNTGLKHLNVDKFWTLYNKTGRDGDYEKYWDKYQVQKRTFLQGRLGLLIDGTAKNPQKMKEVKEALEEMGYETAMVAVNVTLETSLRRVVNRASTPGPDEGRNIDPAFVEETWNRVQKGLGALQRIFGQRFYIVDNNVDGRKPNITYADKELRRWLSAPPKNPTARKWIEFAREKKKHKGLET